MSFNESFQEFPFIETERLLLRELQSDDAEDYFNYFSNQEVTRFWGYDSPKDVKTVVALLSRILALLNCEEVVS